MEAAQAKERNTEARAGSHPCCAAGRPGTDQFEEEVLEVRGQGQSRQMVFDQTYYLERSWLYRLDTERTIKLHSLSVMGYLPTQVKGSSRMSSMDCRGSICGPKTKTNF